MEQQEKELRMLKQVSARIEGKLQKLECFQKFLDNVREENCDEFKEVQDLLSRYKTLSSENERLNKEKQRKDDELRKITNEIETQKNEKIIKKLQQTNTNNEKKKLYEGEENRKFELLKGQEEGQEQILNKTREHGTIIMTIENLNKKLMEGGLDFIINRKDVDKKREHDTIEQKAQNVLKPQGQLEIIEGFGVLFKQFKERYESPQEKTGKSHLDEIVNNDQAWSRAEDRRELQQIIQLLK